MSEENKRETVCFNNQINNFTNPINSAKTTDDIDVIFNTLINFRKEGMYLPGYAGGKGGHFLESAIDKIKGILKLNDDDPLLKDLESLNFFSDDFDNLIGSIKSKLKNENYISPRNLEIHSQEGNNPQNAIITSQIDKGPQNAGIKEIEKKKGCCLQ